MRNINIEIKSKFDNHDKIRNILKQQNADYIGIDFQTDTYFNVRNGSLKLREGNVENKLVYEEYELSEIKNVLLYHTQKNSTLKEILLKTYGIQEIIEKHREVYQINNVRFYIDYVSSLGNFIGIEAQGRNNSHTKDQLIEQCNYYINLFELTEWEYIENPYTGKVDQLTQDNNLHAA
jgi:predicted adenylyl cyclase CyaB